MERGEDFLFLGQINLLNQVLAASADLVYLFDRAGRFLYASPTGLVALGREAADVVGKTWQELNFPENVVERHDAERASVFQTGVSVKAEMQFSTTTGIKEYEYVLSPILGESGKVDAIISTFRDITPRKQAEASILQLNRELQQKVTEFQTLLDVIPIGIGIAEDPQCRRIRVNPAFAEVLGIPHTANASLTAPEEERPTNFKVFCNGRELLPDELPLQVAASRGVEISDLEVDVVWQDGTVVKLLEYAAPLFDEFGEPRGSVGAFLNITDRKQSELALQELNQSLEQIVAERTAELQASEAQIRQQAARDKLLHEITRRIRQSLDLQTIFDTACQEILQWSEAERVCIFRFLPGSPLYDGSFVAEAVVPKFSSILTAPVHNNCVGTQYGQRYQTGWVQISHDIYDAEQSDSNPQGCHLETLRQFQVRANLVVPLFQGDELWGLLCIHQCSAPRQWQPFEIQAVQEITSQMEIALKQANLVEQLQQQLIERQQAQQQLAERNQQLAISNQELARATRLKDEFLANMSHELRTPLNAILGMTEALQEEVYGHVNNMQMNALRTIERTGTHLLALINDILDLAKVESGQIDLDCTPTKIDSLCRSSMDFIRQQAFKKRIRLEMKFPPSLPAIIVDERRMRQVLVNLLNNAVKFTPEGGWIMLEVSLPIVQSIGEPESFWVQFAVSDTGIGIAAENIPKLFRPFTQIDSALNRQYQGTGLGLALVKRIVEMHGGRVELTSQVNVGSCFTIDLPVVAGYRSVDEPKLLLSTQFTAQPNLNQSDRQMSFLILLVEDNEDNIVTVTNYLELKGNRLKVARNGQEAIAMAGLEQPDLILMDIQMAGMDGLEAIQQIRNSPDIGHIPIIALTALAMEGDRERCLAAGANEYLSKPVQLKQLAAKIQQFLSVGQS